MRHRFTRMLWLSANVAIISIVALAACLLPGVLSPNLSPQGAYADIQIRVVSPNGGEAWWFNEQRSIKWEVSGSIEGVTLYLVSISVDGGKTFSPIYTAYGAYAEHSFTWSVPDPTSIKSSQCRIKVVASGGSVAAEDTSDNNFSINLLQPQVGNTSLKVISPNGGEQWNGGETRTISWRADGSSISIVQFQISYTKDGGQTYEPLSTVGSAVRSWEWSVPLRVSSPHCKVRIQAMDANNNIVAQDTSDVAFYIGGSPPPGEIKMHLRAQGASVLPGEYIKYTLIVANLSSDQAVPRLLVADPLPAEVTFVQSVPSAAAPIGEGNIVQWLVKDLEPSNYVAITLTVRVTDGVPKGNLISNQCFATQNTEQLFNMPAPTASPTITALPEPGFEHQSNLEDTQVGKIRQNPFINGYPDGTFGIGKAINRAELAKILCVLYQLPVVGGSFFTDVDPNAWFGGYVGAACNANLMIGYDDGLFHPSDSVTGAQIIVIAGRLAGLAPIAEKIAIPASGDWYTPYFDLAKLHGIGTDVAANQAALRSQVVKVLCQALRRGPLWANNVPIRQHFADCPQFNQYFAWVEATNVPYLGVYRSNPDREELIKYLTP